jgi:hypothetical protein
MVNPEKPTTLSKQDTEQKHRKHTGAIRTPPKTEVESRCSRRVSNVLVLIRFGN